MLKKSFFPGRSKMAGCKAKKKKYGYRHLGGLIRNTPVLQYSNSQVLQYSNNAVVSYDGIME
jgi:hypothetical protein